MNEFEKESIKDVAQSRKTSAKTIFTWIIITGIALMAFAFFGGYLTTGGPNGEHRMGTLQSADSTVVTKSDTTIGK